MENSNRNCMHVEVPGRDATSYEVRVQVGSFADLAESTLSSTPAHRYAIISDSRVASLYGEQVLRSFRDAGAGAELFTFPAGEWNKTRAEWARLSDALLDTGFGRDAVVIALGGGVTGDLAGFVAATYMRGVPHVQVPTSLLAMLDSSVGGKTGLDTPDAKNPIGAFHPPSLVLIDPELLASLPAFQLSSGLAEAVKAAAVADEGLFGWLEESSASLMDKDIDLLSELIVRAVRIKAEVVEADPEETGKREILNFGHTVGHALEALGGFEILHGEAVACGMRVEAKLGELMEVTESGTSRRLDELLAACGLDRAVEEEYPADRLLEAAGTDKKVRRDLLRVVFLRRIGQVELTSTGEFAHRMPADRVLDLLETALRSRSGSADSA